MERLFKVINGGGKVLRMLRTDGEEPGDLLKTMLGRNPDDSIKVEEIKSTYDIPMGHLMEMPFNEEERSCAEILSGYAKEINIFSNKDI